MSLQWDNIMVLFYFAYCFLCKFFFLNFFAGAQLIANVMLDQILKTTHAGMGKAKHTHTHTYIHTHKTQPTWKVEQLKAFIGIAGAYDLIGSLSHFESRGFSRRLLEKIMCGNLRRYSPTLRLREHIEKFRTRKSKKTEIFALRQIPPFFLLHGTADLTTPMLSSVDFANVRNYVSKAEK
jgi:hypothetical protein